MSRDAPSYDPDLTAAIWSDGYYATRREPKITARIRKLVTLIDAAEAVGEEFGACHIVVSDLNYEIDSLRYCRSQPDITPEGSALMDALIRAPLWDRAVAFAAAGRRKFLIYDEMEWAAAGIDAYNGPGVRPQRSAHP